MQIRSQVIDSTFQVSNLEPGVQIPTRYWIHLVGWARWFLSTPRPSARWYHIDFVQQRGDSSGAWLTSTHPAHQFCRPVEHASMARVWHVGALISISATWAIEKLLTWTLLICTHAQSDDTTSPLRATRFTSALLVSDSIMPRSHPLAHLSDPPLKRRCSSHLISVS